MTKPYHITPEQALELLKNLDGNLSVAEKIHALVNAALDKVLGEPVGEVEVRKQRILVDTFQQVTTPIADGRHKLYAPKELK
jgi:aconitase B